MIERLYKVLIFGKISSKIVQKFEVDGWSPFGEIFLTEMRNPLKVWEPITLSLNFFTNTLISLKLIAGIRQTAAVKRVLICLLHIFFTNLFIKYFTQPLMYQNQLFEQKRYISLMRN